MQFLSTNLYIIYFLNVILLYCDLAFTKKKQEKLLRINQNVVFIYSLYQLLNLWNFEFLWAA